MIMNCGKISGGIRLFRCPQCLSELSPSGSIATCVSCGREAKRVAPNLIDFVTGRESEMRRILEWSSDFVVGLKDWVRNEAAGNQPTGDFRQLLVEHGLMRPDGRLTPLGADVHYHVSEFEWQAGRGGLDGLFELDSLSPRPRVLDVGCGAGQTLRHLDPDGRAELFGVDANPNAPALGHRFAQLENIPLTLAHADAYALPFVSGSFDLVLTRVALNYMHQRRALGEMVRVLRPGGVLFCRVEGLRHDLFMLARSRSLRSLLCRFRDLGHGGVLALTGRQIMPGGRRRLGRAFSSRTRLAQTLGSIGCRVIRMTDSPNGPTFLGGRTQFVLIARKEGKATR